jgi:hypothetical protein
MTNVPLPAPFPLDVPPVAVPPPQPAITNTSGKATAASNRSAVECKLRTRGLTAAPVCAQCCLVTRLAWVKSSVSSVRAVFAASKVVYRCGW